MDLPLFSASFECVLSSLLPNTDYYCRPYAVSGGEYYLGDVVKKRTADVGVQVNTLSAESDYLGVTTFTG